jgi:CRISPR/Cas system type I-B associated protein Csh2 (Cas7 group RAMP superfamily)
VKTSLADQVRLGSQLAGVKASMPRKKWKLLVKTAHKQGFTVSGALSDVPSALKERTKSSLVSEAKKTVTSAYKPQEQEATRQQVRLDALAAKRRSDDQTYREWLTNQTNQLTAQARAADVALNGLNQTTVAAAKQDVQSTKQELVDTAKHMAGVVSDPGQSTAINDTYVKAAQNSADQVGHAADKGLTTATSNVNSQDFLKAAVLANANAQRAKTEGTISGDQEKLNEAVTALKGARAGDLQKAITGLLQGEADKAKSNREYDAAAQSLGLKQSQLKLDRLKEKHDYGIKSAQINLAKYKADNLQAFNKAKIQMGYDKIASDEGKSAADRALRKWIAQHKPKHTRGTSDVAIRDSRKSYKQVQSVLGKLTDLHGRHPEGKDSKGNPYDFRNKLRALGADDVTIDIAEDLRRHGGKLSARGLIKAKQLGVARFYGTV